MKKQSKKILLAASLLSVGLASSAPADVFITGSSAYRASVTNAIGHILQASAQPAAVTPPNAAFVGSAGGLASSGEQLFVGYPTQASGLPAATQIIIHTSWSGSLAGLSVLTFNTNTAAKYLPVGVATSPMTVGTGVDSGHGANGGTPLAAGSNNLSNGADAAFSDVYQNSTSFKTPTLVSANGGVVGVVPFVFVANPDTASFVGAAGTKITNVSATQAKQLFAGALDLAQFTGNDNDQGQVLPVGRNADSGTRFTSFAETGFNPVGDAQVQPQQYQVSSASGAIDVSLYPAETLFPSTPAAQSFTAGQSGYGSGGTEAGALSIAGTSGATSDNPSYLIGYIGESDGTTVVKAGGAYLNYNGVAYGSSTGAPGSVTTSYAAGRALLDEGVYTLWGYEHCYYKSGNGNASIIDAIAKEVKLVDAPIAGEILSNMAVQRDYEGGPISYVGIGGSTK